MLEIEQKFANADFPDLERRLLARGASTGGGPNRVGRLPQCPGPRFRPDRRGLSPPPDRQRQHADVQGTEATGSSQGPHRTRGMPLPPGDEVAADHLRLLKMLGYRPDLATVRKLPPSFPPEDGGL